MCGVAEAVAAVAVVLVGLAAACTTSAVATGSGRWSSEEGWGAPGEVTYGHRALVLNGTRRMLFAGEMHYPRSTPEVHHDHHLHPLLPCPNTCWNGTLLFTFSRDLEVPSGLVWLLRTLEIYLSRSFSFQSIFTPLRACPLYLSRGCRRYDGSTGEADRND
jgi:hypothetical protein